MMASIVHQMEKCTRRCELAEFENWLIEKEVYWNASLIEMLVVDGSWGVYAKENVNEGTLLAWIPCSAVLSSKNSQISDLLEQEEIGGGLAVVIAATYEKCLGTRSKWHSRLLI